MSGKRWLLLAFSGIVAVLGSQYAAAGDLKITIPRRSALTPVQRLNREGVDAVRKHNYAKAEELFYKAYLYDPEDAFTLNNLGYIAELQGQIDRAERFYSLAAEQSSDAVIDRASQRRVEGRSMKEALALTERPLQMNHDNVEAVRLLSQGRAPEADMLLQEALKADPEVSEALRGGAAFIVVPLVIETGLPARANLSIDSGLLAAIDEAAQLGGLTRSAFIASAARAKIEQAA